MTRFGGGWTREDVLRILKDSRIGKLWRAGMMLAVALRAGGLIALGNAWLAAAALVIAAAVGRLVILAVMAVVPPVPAREGLAKDVGQVADWGTSRAEQCGARRCCCLPSCTTLAVFCCRVSRSPSSSSGSVATCCGASAG